jgi:hypothetical protein
VKSFGNLQHSAAKEVQKIVNHLLRTPLVAFNFTLPSSAHIISPAVIPRRFARLLSLGTHFIPTDAEFVKKCVKQSLNQFDSRLAWTEKFGFKEDGMTYPLFKMKRANHAPEPSSSLASYLSHVNENLNMALKETPFKRGSYFVKEIEHFGSWALGRVIVKPADKNLGLAVMSIDFYENLCLDYLTKNCVCLMDSEDMIVEFMHHSIDKLLNKHRQAISAEVWQSLFNEEMQLKHVASFYGLPKLHKQPVSLRPIVASHSAPLSKLSLWLSKVLSPCVSRLDSYLRDSSDLSAILTTTTFPKDCVFLTFDVVSMYPNMKRDLAVQGIWTALQLGGYERAPSWAHFAVETAKMLFDHGYSMFDGKVYKQTSGIAMGTNAAPDLANCYLTPFENNFHSVKESILLYKRFIDDGMSIVNSVDTAKAIIHTLKQSGLDFTFEISTESVHFLDLEIFKSQLFASTGLLSFRTYRKSMNRFLYLPAFSAHHPSTIRSWVYAEVLRLRNTNLLDSDFLDAFDFFLNMLLKRGYDVNLIESSLNMLPEELWSPFVKQKTFAGLKPLVDNSGQVFQNCPPLVFRAPYAKDLFVPYGSILYNGFEDWADSISLGARSANPDPTAPTKQAKKLVLANTQAPSLAQRLIRAKYLKTKSHDDVLTSFQFSEETSENQILSKKAKKAKKPIYEHRNMSWEPFGQVSGEKVENLFEKQN